VTPRRGFRPDVIRAFLAKDLRIHARDRFYVVVTIVGVVWFVAIFWLLPDSVDETLHLGVRVDDAPARLLTDALGDAEGFEITRFDTPEDLEAAVDEGDPIVAGLDLPSGFLEDLAAGRQTEVRIVLRGDAPEELRPALSGMVRELAFLLAGEPPPVTAPDMEEAVLGIDRVGAQPSIREQLRPVFVVMALFIEMFALASLVSVELQQRTITAVLATPTRIGDVLAAKTVIGMLLAFAQAAVIVVATGAALRGPLLLAVALLLGAVLVAGVGMIAGSLGRDFIEVVFWSMLIGLPVMIPAFGALFPGSAPGWIRVLPGHGLVQVMVGTTAYGEGWAEAAPYLGMLAAWCAVLYVVGVGILRRRVARL
jgi:ABC-2 type transport system permease protein